MRKSASRSKLRARTMQRNSNGGLNLLEDFKETDIVIEEKLNENDELSESMEIPSNPLPKTKIYKERYLKK